MRFSTLFLLIGAGAANAGVVTIDAANFSPGANIKNATPGITLQEVTNYGLGTSYALNPAYAVVNSSSLDAGPNFIGHNNGNPLVVRSDFRNNPSAVNCYFGGTCNSGSDHAFNGLLMTFQYPTNLIEMRVHRTKDDLDGSYLRLYNKQKQLLASCYVPGMTKTDSPHYVPKILFTIPCGELVRYYDCSSSGTWCKTEHLVRVTRSYPDIAFAVWGGEAASATRGAVNQIAFRRFSDCAP